MRTCTCVEWHMFLHSSPDGRSIFPLDQHPDPALQGENMKLSTLFMKVSALSLPWLVALPSWSQSPPAGNARAQPPTAVAAQPAIIVQLPPNSPNGGLNAAPRPPQVAPVSPGHDTYSSTGATWGGRPPRTVPAGGSRATTTACVVAWCANAIDASPLLHAAAFRVTLQHPPAGCTSCAGSQPASCTIRRWPVGQAVAATVPWPATAFRAHAPPTPQPGC
jgi:hypothetical protein